MTEVLGLEDYVLGGFNAKQVRLFKHGHVAREVAAITGAALRIPPGTRLACWRWTFGGNSG